MTDTTERTDMDNNWKLTVWGVRGSFPVPRADCLEYGGNTACFSLERGDIQVVLDAGSGLAALGERMAREGRRRIDILLSHCHLDHIMGLFPFAPRYNHRMEIHLYGMPGIGRELAGLIGPPLWPVGLAGGQGQIHIHEVWEGSPFLLADGAAPGLTVTALEGNHPGGCLYYRLEGGGRSLVYALDCELSEDMTRRLTDFARGTDLLIWDASFAPEDLKPGWGHSTWEEGLDLGRAAGSKRVLMTHYSGQYADSFLQGQERLARRADGGCIFGREGMVIEL